jgi:CelD/BcsL family acetyltransferase involved in cellulose biosynthesis
MRGGVECDLIRTTGQLESLVPEWSALWQDDPRATPFQSPEWLLPWWHHFEAPELRAVTISQAGALVGFLPFYIYRKPGTGERRLLPLGVATSDYLDGVFRPCCAAAHIRKALEFLRQQGGWDVLYLSQLRAASRLYQALEQSTDWDMRRLNGESCSRAPARRMADLPQKIRRNAMYYRNRALRLGELELTRADASSWAESFEALRNFQNELWRSRGEPGVLADERVAAWHREALPLLEKSGLLRLSSLRLNGEIIGVLYSVVDPPSRTNRTLYLYLPAYSTAHADLRPGTLLIALAMEQAVSEGVDTIDMLRGDEAYKRIWHFEPVPTYCFALRNRGFASAAA